MPQLARREKRGLIALLLAGAVPLGIAGYLSYLDIDPNIQLPPRAARPSPNGFDLYVEAANLSAQPNPPVDASADPNPPKTAAQGAIRYGLARRQAWHAGAAPAWQLFRQAQQTEARDAYGYDTEMMPGYARLRELARNKSAETRMFAMQGANEKAVASALDCVEMAFDISREGALISRLVASAICAIGILPMSETEGQSALATPEQLSGPQARAAATRLEALLARQPSSADSLENERWMVLAMLDKAFARGDWRGDNAFGNAGPSTRVTIGGVPRQEPWDQKLARALTSKRAVVAHIHAGFDDAIAEARAPYKPVARVPNPNLPGSGALQSASRPTLDPISEQFVPGYYLRFNAAREQTQLDLLLLRLALQAYRAEKGAYPPNLAALRGGYLKRIPTDDFNAGNPYFYTRKNGDYRLWSVGPDAKNDGGKAVGRRQTSPGFAAPPAPTLPWQKHLPSINDDSTGDFVARETR